MIILGFEGSQTNKNAERLNVSFLLVAPQLMKGQTCYGS